MAEITLNHVYKKYEGGVTAVQDFTLEIPDKEFDKLCRTFRMWKIDNVTDDRRIGIYFGGGTSD